ncbi:Filamentation induced by cAMP/death on curing, related domain protein [Candidatus Thiomargarita nelsonii]|uniref:Filamentation induced by cAMP/death on curing, related domain protein n=1 Tax=Candidatus Thiomargarita nelsonii TaxID=1003181 RepID=A0A0A6P1R0_9GAMM|nr:Filamentation induced by cAMP/death on curing, related domain protein [Candidatus Thiomargarita nelsonii]
MNKQKLGFTWDYQVPLLAPKGLERACFRLQKLFPEYIFNTVYLEDNPFTFPEVQTLLEGITVGGHKLEDQQQVLNQSKSIKQLLTLVKKKRFALDKSTYCQLHSLVAFEEALEWGVFRSGEVSIAGTLYKPPLANQLDAIFNQGIEYLNSIANPLERAIAMFLFGSLNQFFYDGNKRTSRLMMNGILLSNGFDAINVPAKKKLEFNQSMIAFYDTQQADKMMDFMVNCFYND